MTTPELLLVAAADAPDPAALDLEGVAEPAAGPVLEVGGAVPDADAAEDKTMKE
jgi:hypothetical protein